MKIERKPTYLVGLIGAGIQASLSPAMHEGEGERRGLNYLYQLLDVAVLDLGAQALPRLLDAAQLTGYCGLNITHPYKQQVIPLLDELSEDAAAIGAVNTVVFKDGRRIGHNTDCWGFAQNMREHLDTVRRQDVVLLGAGGAGCAVAHALLQQGVQHLHIHDLERNREADLVESLSRRFGAGRATAVDDLGKAMQKADGLVHATPMGMASHPGLPLAADLLKPAHWVAEVVYFPLETELLRLARGLGCPTVDGSGMAVCQAVNAFRLFTGIEADAAAMRRDFEALVGRQQGPAASAAAA